MSLMRRRGRDGWLILTLGNLYWLNLQTSESTGLFVYLHFHQLLLLHVFEVICTQLHFAMT